MKTYLSYQLEGLLEQPCFEQLPEYQFADTGGIDR